MDAKEAKEAIHTLGGRIEAKVESAVDAGMKKATDSHRTWTIVAIVILGAMIVGAAVWG